MFLPAVFRVWLLFVFCCVVFSLGEEELPFFKRNFLDIQEVSLTVISIFYTSSSQLTGLHILTLL